MKQKKAPKHLRAETRAWWAHVVADYQLEPHHEKLLTLCAEAWDRSCEARAAIELEGLFPQNGRTRKLHPGWALERDSKILFSRLLRELNLDIDAPAEDHSRPPAIQGRYDQ
jgi:phage terminase small subunit